MSYHRIAQAWLQGIAGRLRALARGRSNLALDDGDRIRRVAVTSGRMS